MKVLFLKYTLPLFYFLSTAVVVLLVAAYLLYIQKNSTQNQNNLLILQNDSILSENIRLKNIIAEQQVQHRGKKKDLSLATMSR